MTILATILSIPLFTLFVQLNVVSFYKIKSYKLQLDEEKKYYDSQKSQVTIQQLLNQENI